MPTQQSMTPLSHWFQEFEALSFGGLVSLSIGTMHWVERASKSSGSRDKWAGELVLARCEEGIGWTVGNTLFRIVADAGDYVGACNAIVPESYRERGLLL